MKIPYNHDYTPPAPTVEIWLAAPGEALTVGPIEAFIDSGADVTVGSYPGSKSWNEAEKAGLKVAEPPRPSKAPTSS